MRARTRITLLFVLIVSAILTLVYGSIYYFSYTSRIKDIKIRLTNRAITTAHLLSQFGNLGQPLLQKIDTSTTLALIDKSLVAYDNTDKKIYSYNDKAADSLIISNSILNTARANENFYFTIGNIEAVALNYANNNYHAIIIASGYDKDGRATLYKLQLILWFSFFGSLLLVCVAGYLFSKRLLRPIRKIADEVNEISAQNLARRILSDSNDDEWGYLSGTLNDLLNRLQESFEIQQRFISNASHELSNPLSAISSQLEVSLQRDRDASEYKRVMKSVYQDVLHLIKLTHALLEFAKASGTAGGLEINLLRIDEILLRLTSEILKSNKEYTVSLEFEELTDEKYLLVFGNEELLFTAINNMVVNACKYSPDKSANIKLGVEKTDIIIKIIDNGKGIENTELENIFQPFYRVNDSKNLPGFGLGLSLANRIIKLHKGSIAINSIINKGTTITINLPNYQKSG